MGAFLFGIAMFAVLGNGAWHDAGGRARHDAEVAFVGVLAVATPLVAALVVASTRPGRRTNVVRRRGRSIVVLAPAVIAPILANASWQLVGFAVLGAFLIAATAGMAAIFVLVPPEETARRWNTPDGR
jgi:hypothetical protein